MVKVTTKKRTAEPKDNGILAWMGIPDPAGSQAPAPSPDKDDKPDDLQARLDALSKQVETLSKANAALVAAPISEPQAPPAPKPVSFEGLPDPLDNPQAYTAELNARIAKNFQEQQDYARSLEASQKKNDGAAEALWDDFSTRYEAYAGDPDRIEFLSGKVITAAQKRGIDPRRYVTANRDIFMADIVDAYNKTFGNPTEEASDKDDEPAARKTLGEDDEPNRTGGIFGGAESGGRPAASKQDQGATMQDDLQAIQRRMGIF